MGTSILGEPPRLRFSGAAFSVRAQDSHHRNRTFGL